MRALLVVAALLLASCTSALQVHANVVVDARAVVNDIGRTLNAEAAREYSAADAAHKPAVVAKLEPVFQGYELVQTALDRYASAIRDAEAHGNLGPVTDAAAKLVKVWSQIDGAGASVGFHFPVPPPALVKLSE